MAQQNTSAQQTEQHVIASPNPTIDDSKTPAAVQPKLTATKAKPATSATAAPMKSTTRKHSRKHRRTEPR